MIKITKKQEYVDWEQTSHGNYIKKIGGVFLSYRPEVMPNVLDDIIVGFGGAEDRTGKDETALKVDGIWMILNGDFRSEYDECKTLEECLAVYEKNKEKYRSGFSTDEALNNLDIK